MSFTFFLGTHEPYWLSRLSVPLFLSRRRLRRVTELPKALAPWAIDSGGFSELNLYGRWRTTPEHYAWEVQRWSDQAMPGCHHRCCNNCPRYATRWRSQVLERLSA